MNSIQQDYIRAAAMLEALKIQKQERMLEHCQLIAPDASQDDLDRWYAIEAEVHAFSGIDEAVKAFEAAQVNLLGWARREIERLDWKREGYHEVIGLFERKLNVVQLKKLCDICLRLQTSEVAA